MFRRMAEAGNDGGDAGGGGSGAVGGAGGGNSGGGAPASFTLESLATTPVLSILKDATLKAEPTIARFTNIDDLARSYVSLRKMQGADASAYIQVPGADADDAAWGAVFERLGRPGDAKSYALPKLDDEKYKDAQLDEAFLGHIAGIAHKSGLTQKQLTALIDGYAELRGAEFKGAFTSVQQGLEADTAKLKDQWGAAYQQNVGKADAAVAALDAEGKIPGLAAWIESNGLKGDPMLQRVLYQIGAGMTEAPLIQGLPQGTMLTPDMARAEEARLKGDPAFIKAWTDARHPGHADAIAKMGRLAALRVGQAA